MNTTATPLPALRAATATAASAETLAALADALRAYYEAERDALLAQVSAIERDCLGYAQQGRLTTAEMRERWRRLGGVCPHCGERL